MKKYLSLALVPLFAALAAPAKAVGPDLETEQVYECAIVYDLLWDYGMDYRWGRAKARSSYKHATPTAQKDRRWSDDIDIAYQQIEKAYPSVESRKARAKECDKLFGINAAKAR